jgi:leader peptidase HopD
VLTVFPFLMTYAVITCLLVREDIRFGLLPDKYLCPLLWTGLLYHLFNNPDFLANAVTGAMAGYIGFAGIYWGYRLIFKREGLGYGDVKYLGALGAWHGWYVLPVITLSAALLATLYVLFKMLFNPGLQVHKNPLPFGPFMAAAGLIMGWQSLINPSL